MRFQTVKLADEPESTEVDAERVKFEAVEPAAEGEEEDLTLEQELGLIQAPRPPREERPAEEVAEPAEGEAPAEAPAEAEQPEAKEEEGADK